MKRFNLMVIVVALAVYFCALHTGPKYAGDLEREAFGPGYMMDIVNYSVNTKVESYCQWCIRPSVPAAVRTGTPDNQKFVVQGDYANFADNRMTLTILENTAPLALFFMAAVNVFFYLGKATGSGAIKRMRNRICSWRWRKEGRQIAVEGAPLSGRPA